MAQRAIVKIDQSKCNGCGQCVPACAEGAIQIIEGKARLVSELYCDGLGACLGHCPQGAITLEHREAVPFDEAAAQTHAKQGPAPPSHSHAGGCPGMAVQSLLPLVTPAERALPRTEGSEEPPSALSHWPVQLSLVPPGAPFLREADLLLVADCVPVAYANFHQRFLRGRPLVLGCPKLDNPQAYVDKLAAILSTASVRSLTVLHMEVPCCSGLVRIAQAALARSGQSIPLETITISRRGEILETASSSCG